MGSWIVENWWWVAAFCVAVAIGTARTILHILERLEEAEIERLATLPMGPIRWVPNERPRCSAPDCGCPEVDPREVITSGAARFFRCKVNEVVVAVFVVAVFVPRAAELQPPPVGVK